MKILVTGGAGFIGSHIVDRYIKLGHQVIILDNLSSGKKEFINSQARFYRGDIRDKQSVTDIFKSEKPEILNHHAAQIEVRRSVIDPNFDAQVNILGLINLMELGRKHGLKKVIFASSGGAIYGETNVLPTPETYLPHPSSPYGITKLASEHYLGFYQQTYGIPYLALRYGNVYGPRQNPDGEAGVIAIFSKKLLEKEQPTINGDGKQTRDFVYVDDIVAANILALDYQDSITVNIGRGKAVDINTIFDLLTESTGKEFLPVHGPTKSGEQKHSLLDISLAKNCLKWQPQVSLKTGLQKTIEYFKTKIYPQ